MLTVLDSGETHIKDIYITAENPPIPSVWGKTDGVWVTNLFNEQQQQQQKSPAV